jgi:dihydrodipicolinate synthase/N-acetylneuraminate lyase
MNQLQDLVSGADLAFTRAGIAGTKFWLHKHNGYPSPRVRRPLLDFDEERLAALDKEQAVSQLLAIEKALRG